MSEPEQSSTTELSKNAQKKLLKAEEAAKKKAEKAALKAATAPANSGKPAAEEEILDPTQYYENRLKIINSLQVRRYKVLYRNLFG